MQAPASERSIERFVIIVIRTHIKISQLVASLQTSRQQDVFARLLPRNLSTSLEQVVNNL